MSLPDKNLKQVAVGTSIGLTGALIGAALQLMFSMIVVRLVETSDYGLYTLGIAIVTTVTILSTLGFGNGVPQRIAKYIDNKKYGHARGVIKASLIIIALISCFFSFLIFSFSDWIAGIFNKPELASVLRPLAFMLLANAMIIGFIGVFRGFFSVWPGVFFNELLNRGVRVLGVSLVALMGWGLWGITWSTVAASVLICVIFGVYTLKAVPRLMPYAKPVGGARELIMFSLPLYGNAIMELLFIPASTLLLGYFNTQEQVGFYGVAIILARLLPMPVTALAFIYLPIATKIVSGEDVKEVEKLYFSSTKWIMFITLPILLIILLDAEFIIGILFGHSYHSAADILRILSVGYFFRAVFGLNGMTLLALGKRRAIFLSSAVAASINILLCVFLVPSMGGMGAAIAVTIAMIISNILLSLSLYSHTHMHLFKSDYLKPIMFSVIVVFLMAFIVSIYPPVSVWHHMIVIVIVIIVGLVSPVVTRSMDNYDLAILGVIEMKIFRKKYFTENLIRWHGFDRATVNAENKGANE